MQKQDQNNSNGMKRSLILAGGGMRLAYQAGVLLALEEKNVSFTHIDGTSGGIFNAAMIASGLDAKAIAHNWRQLKIKHFVSPRPLKNYFKPLNMMGYADADGIREKIFPGLGIDLKKINTHPGADTTFNVCNFSEKSVEAIHHQVVTEDHLIAGVSLPIVMPGICIKGQWFSDAVWIKDTNLLEAVQRGAEELWLVWAIGNTDTYLPGALNQYVHMIEMSANGGLMEEYGRIAMINEEIGQGKSRFGQKKTIRFYVIKPELPLPLDPDLYLNKIDARSLINMGYADAKNCLKSMPEEGVEMDKNATKMRDPGTRFNIRSAFSGCLKSGSGFNHAEFHQYLVFSDHEVLQQLRIYSSIGIDGFVSEMPCCDHSIMTSKGESGTEFIQKCLFRAGDEYYELTASWRLSSPIDLLLGLEFKSVYLTVTKLNSSESLYKGRLHQTIKNRLKSLYTTNVRRKDGTSGGQGLRYQMTSKLMNYAI